MKKAAVINDLSGFGKCSLTAAIPVLSALGVQCCPLATAVLTGQTGYPYFHCTDLTEMMPQYTDAWMQNQVHFDAIYSGYMTGHRQIEHLLDLIAHFRYDDTLLLVDPVMGDDGRVYGIYSEDLLVGMKELSRKADVITPNLTEACLLSDTDITKATDYTDTDSFLAFAAETAAKLRDLAENPQDVVITGVKCKKEEMPFIYNIAVTERGVHTSRSHLFNRSFSGTGDLFASVLCGCRVNGMTTEAAVDLAGQFLYHSIADTMNDNVSPNDGINFEKYLIDLINATATYRSERTVAK